MTVKRSWFILLAAAAFFVNGLVIQIGNDARKPYHGVHIIFFCGGPKGDPFSLVVQRGAADAAAVLGPDIDFVWSDWDALKMAVDFREAVEKRPDIICLMGHPGALMLGSLIEEAERKGIIVTLQNVDLPTIRRAYIDRGFGYVGEDLHASGYSLAEGLVRRFGLTPADTAVVTGPGMSGDKKVGNERAARTRGIVDGLERAGLAVAVVPLPQAVEKDPLGAGEPFFKELLARHPGIKCLVVDQGSVTAAMGQILSRLGQKPADLVVGGFDLSPRTVDAIRSGYVAMVHDQQPYLEGFFPVLQGCLAKRYGFAGFYIDTGVGLIDSSNIDMVAEWARRQVR